MEKTCRLDEARQRFRNSELKNTQTENPTKGETSQTRFFF
jgi:hypothetical protein